MKKTIRCWCCIRPDGLPDMGSIRYVGKKETIQRFVEDLPVSHRLTWWEYLELGWSCKRVILTVEPVYKSVIK